MNALVSEARLPAAANSLSGLRWPRQLPVGWLIAAWCGACAGPPSGGGFDVASDPAMAGLGPSERDCVLRECGEVDGPAELATCRTERCTRFEETWAVNPTRIRYEDGAVFAQARVAYAPGRVGDWVIERAEPVWVGVTVIKVDGEEFDLAVQTLFPGGLDAEVTLSADVGDNVQDIVFGAWSEKIAPCDVDRMGCRNFGFVLDGSLATWPPHFYRDWHKQRILGPRITLRVVGGAEAMADAASRALQAAVEVFGTEVERTRVDGSGGSVEVRYRHPSDVLLAMAVADAVAGDGSPPPVALDPAVDADLVLRLP